jgi:hypothetical protein
MAKTNISNDRFSPGQELVVMTQLILFFPDHHAGLLHHIVYGIDRWQNQPRIGSQLPRVASEKLQQLAALLLTLIPHFIYISLRRRFCHLFGKNRLKDWPS